jgi:hypothetical protein
MKRLLALLAAVFAALLGTLVLAAPASAATAADDPAQVTVVHGIPDTPVNVFVNGSSTLPDFKPGTVAGPLSLPPGDYEVTVFPASDTKGTGTPVISAKATVPAGANVTLVAHLTADGEPTLTPFVNDTSAVAMGQGRLVVRHTAAAPAVDVRAGGKVVFADLTNPNEAKADLPAGTVSADVVLAGTDTVVIGPADVAVKEGVDTIVYAIGSASDKTLSVVVQTIDLGTMPAGVPAGTGGQAAEDAVPGWVLGAIGAGALLLLFGLLSLRPRPARG